MRPHTSPLPAISQLIWDMKYRLKGADGAPADANIADTLARVAKAVAGVEPKRARARWAKAFTEAISTFAFLPAGSGRKLDEPVAVLLAINRAKESPREIEPGALQVRSRRLADGYFLEGFVAAEALTGFSPADQPALGFSYAAIDRELGWQTFSVGQELPFTEDPSLWGTLNLTR